MQLRPVREFITAGLEDGQAFADGQPDIGDGGFGSGGCSGLASGSGGLVVGGGLIAGFHPADGGGSDDYGSCCQE